KKAGVVKWTPHQLRHTYATEVRRQFGIEAARILLGHASIVTTEIYAEVDRQAAQKVALAIG
ncbi:MAG: site-specific integrase, partial [Planctomycetes bacterium]|nr:site-specific integrase [Planctomycetota bacterium]